MGVVGGSRVGRVQWMMSGCLADLARVVGVLAVGHHRGRHLAACLLVGATKVARRRLARLQRRMGPVGVDVRRRRRARRPVRATKVARAATVLPD